jgi:cytochrome c oxidase subunit 4
MSDHSHSHSHDEAHSHSPEEVAKHKKVYIAVFIALLVGTVVTVALNWLHFDSKALTIAIALFVATIKATLVACYFMHLISEKKMIYIILGFTTILAIALMVLTLSSYAGFPNGTVTH